MARTNSEGELIPSDDVRVSNIRANASKSSDGSSTSETSSAGFTLGNRKASVSPAMFSNKNTNETKFDDGVILNQEGESIGFALNGEVVLNEGVRIRGGIEKTTNSYNGRAVYKGEVIDGFAGSSVGRGANVGLTAGKLNLDYSQREQEGSPKYEKLSGRYDLGNGSNITGDIDSEKNINVTYNKRFAKGGAALKTHDGLSVVENDSGEVMSEVSITVTDPRLNKGKPTNIPSLWGGKIVDEDVAVTNALKTKKEYRSFESIDEAVNDAVRKSNAGGANAPATYAKGGNVEQMNKLFADGGMMDDSGEQVNGVEVPVGSLKEEVADDIPAQLSEGEFVVPADVVRFIGLEKLMQLRDKAKEGLKRMEEMGQMGNAEEVSNPDQSFMQDDEDFSSEIDDIMAEDEPAEMMAEEAPMPAGFARGGFASGTDLTKASQNPAVDVRFFKNKEGKVMFITHINGVPLAAIPEGFEQTDDSYEKLIGSEADKKAAEEEAEKAAELKRLAALGMGTTDSGGSSMPDAPTSSGTTEGDLSRSISIDPKTGAATAKDYSNYAKLAMLVTPGPIGLGIIAGAKIDAKRNEEVAKQWNAAERYFNPEYAKDNNKETGWVSMAFAKDTGTGFTVDGRGVSSTQSVQAQNDAFLSEFNLNADDARAAASEYAVPGTAEANFQREASLMDKQESLNKSIMQGESRARAAARETAAKEAAAKEAADAKRAFETQERAAAAETARAEAARAAEINAQAASRAARQAGVGEGYSSRGAGNSRDSSNAGAGGSGSVGSGGGNAGGGYGSGGWAKGGIITKRETKPKSTKKGLASKRK
jgi:hypothetical protein